MESNEDDWYVECSDDEKYEVDPKAEWILKPDELMAFIETFEKNKQVLLDLEWQCPGRRGPSPVPSANQQQESSEEFKPEEKSDFDFMDEMASPRIPVRKSGEIAPKGSAKKKTANFNAVISTMIRHRKMEQQENSSPARSDCDTPSPKPQST